MTKNEIITMGKEFCGEDNFFDFTKFGWTGLQNRLSFLIDPDEVDIFDEGEIEKRFDEFLDLLEENCVSMVKHFRVHHYDMGEYWVEVDWYTD